MGLLANVIERREWRQSTLAAPSDWLRNALAGPRRSATGAVISPEKALGLAAFYACVSLIAETIASLPWFVYQRTAGGGRQRAPQHPLYPLLHDQPNGEMTSFEFREALVGHLETWGNAYAEIEVDQGNRPIALWPLRPDKMDVTRAGGQERSIKYVYTVPSGRQFVLPPERVLHWKGLSPDGLIGYSRLSLMREAIGLGLGLEEYQARFFGNDSRPGGVLEVPGRLSDDAAKRLVTRWEAAHQGLGRAHRVAVLEEGVSWKTVGVPPQTSQFIESRQFQRSEIAMIMRVPPHMIGDVTPSTSWGCLPAETLVFTTRGPVPIVDVRPGEWVWSLGMHGLVPARVRGWQMTGIRQLRQIDTSNRTLRLTENHWLPVRRFYGKSAGRGKGQAGWETDWIQAADVQPGDYVAVPHELPVQVGRTAPNGRALTVGAMEFCGAYLGDGSRDKNRVELAHERGADYLAHYIGAIRDEFGAVPYTDKRGTRTRFSSREAISLLECGFTGTAHTKRVPSWVFGLAPDLIAGLLRGYVDSDGTIRRGRIIYASAHAALLEDVRHLCMQIGVPVGRVVLARRGGAHAIRGRDVQSTNKYHLALSSVAHNARINSNSPKKQANLIAAPHKRTLTFDADWRGGFGRNVLASRSPGGTWPYPDLKLVRVRSNRALNGLAVPVYDIQVEGTASFIADGVLVHNTGIEQQQIGFVTFTLRARLERIEQASAMKLFMPFEQTRYYNEFEVDGLLRGDSASRATYLQTLRQNGVINAAYWAQLENLPPPPADIGDVYIVPANMQPVEQLLMPEPAPAPSLPPGLPDQQSTQTNALPLPSGPTGLPLDMELRRTASAREVRDYHCRKCGRLLFRSPDERGRIETVCPQRQCRELQTVFLQGAGDAG